MENIDLAELRTTPIFATLDDDGLAAIAPAIRRVQAEAGAVVMREGETAYRMYCIVEGQVQIIKNYLQEGSQTIALLGPGNVFGEMAFVGADQTRSATVVTTEATTLFAIDRSTFKGILETTPGLAINLLFEAYTRLRQANELIATLRTE